MAARAKRRGGPQRPRGEAAMSGADEAPGDGATSQVGDEEARRAAVLRLVGDEGDLPRLLEALGDTSWRVRKEAAARAAHWRDPGAAAAALVQALAEPENVGRRNAAVEGLVRLGPIAVAPLCEALSRAPEHRKLIVDALGLIGDHRAALPLAGTLADADPNVRAAAAEGLGCVGGPIAKETLTRVAWEAFARGELLLSLACIEGVNRIGAPLPVERLVPLLATPVLRPAALDALGHSGDPAALPHLIASVAAHARGAREAAVSSLERLHGRFAAGSDPAARDHMREALHALPEDAEKLLIEALLEGAPSARRSAAALLGWAGRGSAVRALALALADPGVQEAASAAIVAIGGGALPTLCGLVRDLDGPLCAAIYALLPELPGAAADAAVRELLLAALDDDEVEAAAAARALGEVGDRTALAPLCHALSGPSRVALGAASALGRLGGAYGDEVRTLVLARGLHEADAPHVCRVLGALGHPEDAPVLLVALRSDLPAVRRAAAEALAGLVRAEDDGPPAAAPPQDVPEDPGDAVVPPAADRSGSEVERALCFALADEVSEVRVAAARALGARPSVPAAEALAGACADGDAAVRSAAARALARMVGPSGEATPGATRALAVLRALAGSADGATAVHALEALGRTAPAGRSVDLPAADQDLLLGALLRDDVEVVKAAVRALARVGDGPALAGLGHALAHPRWDVRRVAAWSLGERGGAVAVAWLEERRAIEEDPLVTEAITTALAVAARR
ncbi:MAG: hypothetical protein EXR72_17400 [Myxococcales bacterium]|nr:hypothetical protein [Myxococcales bacterium]